MFTRGEREKISKLYSLSLSKERERISALNAHTEPFVWCALPESASDSEVTSLLAKSYKKDDLSEVDRYHGKLGDVGVKAMKKAIPSLDVPAKHRCVHCIEGKMHKRAHKKCKEGERTKYLPGVCLHTDHSGPYKQSLGGHTYSQVFMDMGSGYVWAKRMKAKTGHYQALPEVLADARAASGRRVQFFQSDGDGVFTSKETEAILRKGKIRHLKGAPHDSNTNPFIERVRRTIFEGTATSLIRSGAPTSFWGEAEAHKVFTMNVLPTFEDPDNKGTFLSRKNLLENDRRPFNLEHLMAFGTAATCYVPVQMRSGGKTPGQNKYFRGVIVGYQENCPAYRVWDIADKKVRIVSYNFTIAHEGFYPFKDKSNWPETGMTADVFDVLEEEKAGPTVPEAPIVFPGVLVDDYDDGDVSHPRGGSLPREIEYKWCCCLNN